jgi:hypothetical protein
MAEFKSGKQLCDDFFTQLSIQKDLDTETINPLVELYSTGQLTPEKIRKALKGLRDAKKNTK